MITVEQMNDNKVRISYHDVYVLLIDITSDMYYELLCEMIIIIDGRNSAESILAYKRLLESVKKTNNYCFAIVNTVLKYSSDTVLQPCFFRYVKELQKYVDEAKHDTYQRALATYGRYNGQTISSPYGSAKVVEEKFIDFIFNASKCNEEQSNIKEEV
jgi:hypothetical protein